MKCLIKSENYEIYFEKHLFGNQSHFVFRENAKVFDSVKLARDVIKKVGLKKVKVVKL